MFLFQQQSVVALLVEVVDSSEDAQRNLCTRPVHGFGGARTKRTILLPRTIPTDLRYASSGQRSRCCRSAVVEVPSPVPSRTIGGVCQDPPGLASPGGGGSLLCRRTKLARERRSKDTTTLSSVLEESRSSWFSCVAAAYNEKGETMRGNIFTKTADQLTVQRLYI